MATDTTASTQDGLAAVLTPDGTMHAVVGQPDPEHLALACGLLTGVLPAAESPDAPLCTDCMNGTTAPDLAPAPQQPEQVGEAPAQEAPAPVSKPKAEAKAAPKAEAATPATRKAEPRVGERLANQPSKEALATKTIGHYSLEQPKKGGQWRLRALAHHDPKMVGQLLPEGFELYADAAWYAQRRSRLTVYSDFGGTRQRPVVKVPNKVGDYEIVGEVGKLRVLNAQGEQVGPIWTNKVNGRVDAFRWIERIQRPGRAALAASN